MKHLTLSLLMLLAAVPLVAQPELQLRKLRPHSPDYYYYHLYFAATCDGQTIMDLDEKQLILREEGELVDTNRYKIDRRPEADRNSCFDAVLAFDNSAQVDAEMLQQMMEGGERFIEEMNRDCQRTAVLTFANSVIIREFLTDDVEKLRSCLGGMTPGGKRAVYDAIYSGYTEFYTHGYTRIQPLILITTGADVGSSMDITSLTGALIRADLRLFVVQIGNGQEVQALASLAYETGGSYYNLSAVNELPPLLEQLAGYVRREYDEYRLVRSTRSVDNKETFRISMRLEACGDSSWADRRFMLRLPATDAAAPAAPVGLELGQAWPHPLRVSGGAGSLRFSLPTSHLGRHVSLRVYDVLGRETATLFDGVLNGASQLLRFDVSGMAPGTYLLRLRSGDATVSRRLVVIP